MRKVHILKAIIDFIWIVSLPTIPLIILFIPAIFWLDVGDLNLTINSILFNRNDITTKLLLAITLLNYLLLITSIFYFRKTLYFFLRVKIFDAIVIKNFNKIEILLFISSFISLAVTVANKIHFNQKSSLEIGVNPHILMISLGLFFMALSSIFKISKTAIQENNLTI